MKGGWARAGVAALGLTAATSVVATPVLVFVGVGLVLADEPRLTASIELVRMNVIVLLSWVSITGRPRLPHEERAALSFCSRQPLRAK